jgi:hypothetical protein
MGYQTSYELDLKNAGERTLEIMKEFLNFYEEAAYALDENGGARDQVKWYDHEENLVEFSRKYPEIVFTLSGEGEDAGDMWKKYFRNGKKQIARAVIAFNEYDESKLR